MATNTPEYHRKYRKERKVEVYPAIKDRHFIDQMRLEKPGMSRSAVAAYLISIGIKSLQSKNGF